VIYALEPIIGNAFSNVLKEYQKTMEVNGLAQHVKMTVVILLLIHLI
jgi:hypothetical protein